MRVFVSMAAIAALTWSHPALGDSISEEEIVDPCASGGDCGKKKTGGGKKAAPPPPEPTPVAPEDTEPPVVVIDDPPPGQVEIIFDGEPPSTPASAEVGNWLHFGAQGGASAGTWGVPRNVLSADYYDFLPAADGFAGAYLVFGGHHGGAPICGVSGSAGLGSIMTRTWRATAECGGMFSDHVGLEGVAGLRLHQFAFYGGGFANEFMGGEFGPQLVVRLDDPSADDFGEGWLYANLTAGPGSVLDEPGTYANVTAAVGFRGGLNLPGKKKATVTSD